MKGNHGLTNLELSTLAHIYDYIIKFSTEIKGDRYAIYPSFLLLTFQQKRAMNRCFNKFFTWKAEDPLEMSTLDSMLPSIFILSYIHNQSNKIPGGYWVQFKTTDEIRLTFSRELFEKMTSFVRNHQDKDK